MSYQQQQSTGEAQSTGHQGHESPSAGEGSGNNHNSNNNGGGNNNMAPGFGGQQQQQQGGPGMTGSGESQNGGESEKTTLWMGELEPWIDEGFVRQVWFNLGEQVSVKMIRDKFSGNAGYCFVDFESTAAATKAISLNGTLIPNTSRPFKLNWASGGGLSDRKDERGPEYSIFVGDLGPEVNEYILVSLFQSRFPSCKSAKIMTDPMSGLSRGYGFVRFADEMDQQRALTEMQGVYCGNRPMRISTATPKNKPGQMMQPMMQGGHPGQQPQQGGQPQHMGMMQMGMPQPFYAGVPQPMNQFTDPNNTTVFVGGLSGYVTEDELRSFFQGFGEITYVKIPPGKGCGFVQFVQRLAAEMAINQMQGYPIGNSRVRLSWGRSQMNSGPAGTPYRPAPPQQMYPSMGMPPQHAYSPFAPMNPHAQPHVGYGGMHPAGLAPQQQLQQQQQGGPGGQPGMQMSGPPGQPGAMPTQDPMEPANTQKMNEYYQGGQQDRMQRMDNDARGFGGIYAS